MIDQIGGRKLAAVLVTLTLASVAVILKGDVPPQFTNVLEFLFAAFVAGNGVEHVTSVFASGDSAPPADVTSPPVDLTEVHTKLDALESHEATTQQAISTVQQTLTFIIQKTGIGNKS